VLGHRPGGREIKPPAVLLAALAGTHVVGAEPVEIYPTTRPEQIRKTLKKAMVDPYIPRVRR
jgi:hypothetical protein